MKLNKDTENSPISRPTTAFIDATRLSTGPLIEVALAVKNATNNNDPTSYNILTFDDTTGQVIDLDLRGTKAEIIARLMQPETPRSNTTKQKKRLSCDPEINPPKRARGRPKLGVIAREVTLLPRHWEWLKAQRGGASATLRQLVDEAKKTGGTQLQKRQAIDTAYKFMSAMAGDYEGFEEASRALFADDKQKLEVVTEQWPDDVCSYLFKLAYNHRNNNNN